MKLNSIFKIKLQNVLLCMVPVIFLCSVVYAGGANSYGEKKTPPAFQSEAYDFCRGGLRDGCEGVVGEGSIFCRDFKKILNDHIASKNLMVCELGFTNKESDISIPEWREVSIDDSLRIIYSIEMYLIPGSRRVKTKLAFNDEDPSTWNEVSYQEWLEDFKGRIKRGEIEPKLSISAVALNERGKESVVSYEDGVGGNSAECKRNLANPGYLGLPNGGSHIFLLKNGLDGYVRPILAGDGGAVGSKEKSMMFLWNGRAVFLKSYFGNPKSIINLSQSPSLKKYALGSDLKFYITKQICSFR